MLTKQDLDSAITRLLEPVVFEPVTICGEVCYSPEDITRLGVTDIIRFEEYQQIMDGGFRERVGL